MSGIDVLRCEYWIGDLMSAILVVVRVFTQLESR